MSFITFFKNLFSKKQETPQTKESENKAESDFKTIKITSPTDKTLKFIPGQFIVLTGRDRGKPIRVAGFPTPEGSIVTVGREEASGERTYAHIQIELQTISRKQAELIYKEKKLFIKNLSETNPTLVNETEVKLNETMEVPLESEIRMGEIKFKYIL